MRRITRISRCRRRGRRRERLSLQHLRPCIGRRRFASRTALSRREDRRRGGLSHAATDEFQHTLSCSITRGHLEPDLRNWMAPRCSAGYSVCAFYYDHLSVLAYIPVVISQRPSVSHALPGSYSAAQTPRHCETEHPAAGHRMARLAPEKIASDSSEVDLH